MLQERLPSISIVIPTLNEAANIGRLLNALLAQSHMPCEIIVCDGGSTDETRAIVREKMGGPANRAIAGSAGSIVRLFECERGTARQRNAGAAASNGDLLIFLDADNLPYSRFCECIARSFQRLPFTVACPWFIARDSKPAYLCYLGFNVLFFLGQAWLRTGSGVCQIVPRVAWERAGGYREDLHLGEDVEFLRRCARQGLHRHLLIPLETSGRRFAHEGMWRLMWFYAAISPLVLLGRWDALQRVAYRAAPYQTGDRSRA